MRRRGQRRFKLRGSEVPQNTIPYFLAKVDLREFVDLMNSPSTMQTILQKSDSFPGRAARAWGAHQILAAELAEATRFLRSSGFCAELCSIANDLVAVATPRRDQVRRFMRTVYESLALARADLEEDVIRGLKTKLLCTKSNDVKGDGPAGGAAARVGMGFDPATATEPGTSVAVAEARHEIRCHESEHVQREGTLARPGTPDLSRS